MAQSSIQPILALNLQVATFGTYPSGGGIGSSGSSTSIGTIHTYAFGFDRGGDTGGDLFSIASNSALFSLLGTTYGGDGESTFALPDLEGKLSVGAGNGPGLTNHNPGASFGSNTIDPALAQYPASLGGGSTPVGNVQASQAVHYMVNVGGNFPSESGGNELHGFLGQVMPIANANQLPAGWALADGSLISIASNSALFSILGTTYGGDGETTFALPDLRGRVPVGEGQGPGLDNVSLGEKFGSETVSITDANLPVALGGSGIDLDNHQPTLGLTYLVSLVGTYPSRDRPPSGDLIDLGEVIAFAGNFVPRGYAEANGQLLPISSNTALFSLLGTAFGGDGRTTFALPDLRGRAIVDSDDGTWRQGTKTGDPDIDLVRSDFLSPDAPLITDFSDDTGNSDSDGFTTDPTLMINGTAVANATIEVFLAGTSIGTTTADGSGDWTFDYTGTTLAEADHSFTATATVGGYLSPVSSGTVAHVDNTAPTAPTAYAISTDSGTVGDAITNDATPIITGSTEPNALVDIVLDGVPLAQVQADGFGDFVLDLSAGPDLAEGPHTLSITLTDLAGNVATDVDVFTFVVDTIAPGATTPALDAGSDTGNPGDAVTFDTTPTFSGTAEADATVTIFDGATNVGSVLAGSDGAWSITTSALTQGAHSLTATVTDVAGNTSDASAPVALTVDLSVDSTDLPVSVTVAEDTPTALDTSGIVLSAPATTTSVELRITATGGTLVFAGSPGITDTSTGNKTLILTGSVANLNAALATAGMVTFTGAENANGTAVDAVTFTATDAYGPTTLGTISVAITAENDAPTATGIPTDITAGEDAASNVDLSGVTFTDVDGDALTVTLTASAGSFASTSVAPVVVGGSGTGTLTLTGSPAAITAFLDDSTSVTYTGAANVFGDDAATMDISANDGSGASALGSVNIDISPVDDAPTATDVPTDVTVLENTASAVDLSGVTFADIDSSLLSVSLMVSAGVLTSSAAGVTGSGTNLLSFTGTAAQVNAVFGSASAVQYTGEPIVFGDDAATLTISTFGASGVYTLGTVNLDIDPVNDAPTVTGVPASVIVPEDLLSPLDLTGLTFGDVDGDPLTVTLSASAGLLSAANDSDLTIAGTSTGTLSLTGTLGNLADYFNVAGNVGYTGATNANGIGAATITVSAIDGNGGALASDPDIAVNITPINDAPGGDPIITGTARAGGILTANASGISDVDGLGPFMFQWLADGAPIAAAVDPTLTLDATNVGQAISVEVSYLDGDGTTETLASAATNVVTNDVKEVRGAIGMSAGTNMADALSGGRKTDYIDGGGGDDLLIGGGGQDFLYGGADNDTLLGGNGNDWLFGNTGDDRLTGGKGADVFVFVTGDGVDVITDFGRGNDVLNLRDLQSVKNWKDLKNNHLSEVGTDVVIDGLNGDSITLLDTTRGDLARGDFDF